MVCENVLFLTYNNNHHNNNYYLYKCLRLLHNIPDLYNPDPPHIPGCRILKNHIAVFPVQQHIFHSRSFLFEFLLPLPSLLLQYDLPLDYSKCHHIVLPHYN